ncbi:hypothetical protein KC315_g9608 [Hortaea werneckii]|nr:hypothetical protein KC315_g9608 [Hortaea werneckii]KAI7358306.1 hypothetical protein KC354_g9732 [Hortaea werneckii]
MSININVTLPLDAVAAMQTLPDETSDEKAKAAVTPAMAQAMLAAIKALPFSVTAKSAADEGTAEIAEDPISIWVKGTQVNVQSAAQITINPAALVFALKVSIWRQYGVPYDQQTLLFNNKKLQGNKTLKECNIVGGSEVIVTHSP